MTDLVEICRSVTSIPPGSTEPSLPYRQRAKDGMVPAHSEQGRGAHFPDPFRTLLPNRPETAGDRAQITDLGELYPTMPSVPRETLI